MSADFRGVIGTLVALGAAWLAWAFAPRLIALIGLDDLEFMAGAGAVILILVLLEAIAVRLPGGGAPEH